MTVVNGKTDRDKAGSAGENYHILSDCKEPESETDLESLDAQDLWYATDDKAEHEAMIGLREARKKLEHVTKSRLFYKKDDNGRERVTSNRSKSIQGLKKVTTCNRCGALGHWEDECLQRWHRRRSSASDRSNGSGRSVANRVQDRGRSPNGKGKGRRVKFEEAFFNARSLPW